MKKITSILILSGILLITGSLFAQHRENVIVVAPYQPTISDANKINQQPVITDTALSVPKLNYDFLTRKFTTEYQADPIKPAKVGDATLPKYYKFLLKAGFGNYIMPYGELFVNNTYSKGYSAGAYLKHLSVSGKIKDYAFPGNSENNIKVYGKRLYKEHTLYGSIAYNRLTNHYYGFKPADLPLLPTLNKSDYKQRFNIIKADFDFRTLTTAKPTKLNYSFGLNYYYLNDYYKTSENNFDFTADANKDFHLFKNAGPQILGITAKINYFFGDDTTQSYNAGIISLKPYIKSSFKIINFRAGIDVATAVDSLSKMHFYPFADFDINIVKNILVAFGGVKGGLVPNSFYSLTSENPFLVSKTHVYASSEKYNVFAGLKTNISKSVNFSVVARYSNVLDMPLFVNDTTVLYGNQFKVIFDHAKIFQVSGEVAYQKDEKLKLILGANYYNYKMSTELKAWNKPLFDAYLDFHYNIGNKFIVSANIKGRSQAYAKIYEGTTVAKKTLKGYADIGLGFEYRYSKILSAFVNINNLTATRYYLWNNYPSYGFNMLAGVTYAF